MMPPAPVFVAGALPAGFGAAPEFLMAVAICAAGGVAGWALGSIISSLEGMPDPREANRPSALREQPLAPATRATSRDKTQTSLLGPELPNSVCLRPGERRIRPSGRQSIRDMNATPKRGLEFNKAEIARERNDSPAVIAWRLFFIAYVAPIGAISSIDAYSVIDVYLVTDGSAGTCFVMAGALAHWPAPASRSQPLRWQPDLFMVPSILWNGESRQAERKFPIMPRRASRLAIPDSNDVDRLYAI